MRRAPLVDRLLVWLFGAARQVFLLQALAFGCACAATLAWTSAADRAPWLTRALWSAGLLSGTFVAAGLLLWRMRSWPPASASPAPAIDWPWRLTLAASLALMAVVTLTASAPLPSLWREILAPLTAAGFWDELKNPGPFGGIIIVPILLALFVPALVTVAVIFSALFPLVLLVRLWARTAMFPVLMAMGAVCQTALVGSGWFATKLLSELAQAAGTEMLRARDVEVVQLAAQLTDVIATLMKTATVLIGPAVALVAWAVFLRPSGRAAGAFGETIDATAGRPDLARREREERVVAFSAEAGPPPPRRQTGSAAAAWGLAGLGVMMVLFWMSDSVRPRAAYVTSTPQPAASLTAAPPAIRVAFDRPLESASAISLVYLPVVGNENDIARDVSVVSRLASDDGTRRTLEALPPRLGTGLYLVRWTAYSSGGGVIRHGSFGFGVGAAVPPDSDGRTLSLTERDSGGRGRRSTILGGAILLVLAGLAFYSVSLDAR